MNALRAPATRLPVAIFTASSSPEPAFGTSIVAALAVVLDRRLAGRGGAPFVWRSKT
jgi:hypothetical protein